MPSAVRLVVDAVAPDPSLIAEAGAALKAGKLVAIPTETVYGLGANALDPAAVQAIFEAKGRPASDPLIAHVDGPQMLSMVAATPIPDHARLLTESFWPGPLTIVVPRHPDLPSAVTSGLPDSAVRCPAHPVASAIITAAGVPIAAPSANRFSRVSPTSADHVLTDLGDRIDMVVDAGRSEHGLESTVVGFDADGAIVLRHGAIPLEALAEVVPARMLGDGTDPDKSKASPGHDERHYSPRTPTVTIAAGLLSGATEDDLAMLGRPGVAYAGYDDSETPLPDGWTFVSLGRRSKVAEVAHGLYETLRSMDRADVELIVVELTSVNGLGRAVDDRLTRAGSSRVIRNLAALTDVITS